MQRGFFSPSVVENASAVGRHRLFLSLTALWFNARFLGNWFERCIVLMSFLIGCLMIRPRVTCDHTYSDQLVAGLHLTLSLSKH